MNRAQNPRATGQVRLTLSRRQCAALYLAGAHAAAGITSPLNAEVALNAEDALERMRGVMVALGVDLTVAGDARPVHRKREKGVRP